MQKYRPSVPDPEPSKKEETEEPVGSYSPFILLPPALCDVTATSIMYVALTLTSASSFQMLRGSILIFVGILSVLVLRRKLEWFRWLGMFIILVGLIVVGVSDFLQVQLCLFPQLEKILLDDVFQYFGYLRAYLN